MPGKRIAFIGACFTAVLFASINSSFIPFDTNRVKINPAFTCSGPFYTGNALGANFSILSAGTGAPDNAGTCARSGCHTTFADNSGSGTLTIDVGNGITEYIPGQTYTVKVTLTQSGITAMDFQLTVRSGASTSQASGTLSLTDAGRTKLTNGSFGGAGTKYIEGTACGIDVVNPGYNEWTFNWKAPESSTGDVTFYVGAVAANFNNQNSGDYTYSDDLTLMEQSTLGLKEQEAKIKNFGVYPNPAADNITVDYAVMHECNVAVRMFDVSGKEAGVLFDGKQAPGNYKSKFELSGKYAPGFYIVRIDAGAQNGVGRRILEIK